MSKSNFKLIKIKKRKQGVISEKERQYRQEASRLASMANKRIKRMEEQNLLNSPAYQKWLESGGVKFGVKGKNYEEVKQEVTRLNQFLKQVTSTVTGSKNYFKQVASQIGVVKWEDMNDLQNKINVFFETTQKVKEYLHNSKEIGVAIGYQKVWEVVSDYVQEMSREQESLEGDLVDMVGTLFKGMGHGKLDELVDDWLDSL